MIGSSKKTKELDLTQGVIWKQLLRFFWPMWLGMLFQTLYTTADALIVGRLVGSSALAAVGNTGAVVNLFIGLFSGLSAGATVLTAQYFGARNRVSLERCVGTALGLAGVLGLVLTVVAVLLAPWVVRAIDTPEEIFRDSVVYLQIFALGMVPMSVYNMGAAILRGLGDSRRPVWILVAASVCNIALDIVLVTVVPWGVAGVAAATSVSQLLSMVLVLAIFFRGQQEGLHLRPASCIPGRVMTGQVLRIGIPTAVQSTSYNFTNLLLQAGINSFGTATVAAWTAYSKVDVLYWLTLNAMSAAVVTFVGQNYGARKIQRMERGIRTSLWMTALMTVAASALLILFREGLFRIFTDDAQVVAIGCDMLRYLTLFYILFTVMEIYSGAVRATGDAFWPMILNLISVCVVRVAWVLLVLPRFHTVIVLCTSYPVSWGLGSILFWLYYRSRRWDKHNLTEERI